MQVVNTNLSFFRIKFPFIRKNQFFNNSVYFPQSASSRYRRFLRNKRPKQTKKPLPRRATFTRILTSIPRWHPRRRSWVSSRNKSARSIWRSEDRKYRNRVPAISIKKSRKPCKIKAFGMVPVAGVEPARPCGQQILSLSSLPIPSHRQLNVISIPQKSMFCKTLPGIFLTFFKLCESYIAILQQVCYNTAKLLYWEA